MANLTGQTSALISVAELSEAAKSVIESAFHLHLLGLNARVLATRLGVEARGFGVLSAEWVQLGRHLEAEMHRLEETTEGVVKAISRDVIRNRRRTIIRRADTGLQAFSFRLNEQEAKTLFETRQNLRSIVDEALRGCTFGIVIARSAKIEAAWSAQARAALAALATEFEQRLATILPSLRTLSLLELRGLKT